MVYGPPIADAISSMSAAERQIVALPSYTREHVMPSKHQDDLKRTSAETHARAVASHTSCEQTSEAIISSRNVIARSLALLGRRFYRLDRD